MFFFRYSGTSFENWYGFGVGMALAKKLGIVNRILALKKNPINASRAYYL
jgi:hypothetical protein